MTLSEVFERDFAIFQRAQAGLHAGLAVGGQEHGVRGSASNPREVDRGPAVDLGHPLESRWASESRYGSDPRGFVTLSSGDWFGMCVLRLLPGGT